MRNELSSSSSSHPGESTKRHTYQTSMRRTRRYLETSFKKLITVNDVESFYFFIYVCVCDLVIKCMSQGKRLN